MPMPIIRKPMAAVTFFSNTLYPSTAPSIFHFNQPQKPLSPKILSFLNKNSTQNPIPGLDKRSRGLSVVTRAGPSSSSYIFAFVFPFSLLAITIFSSMRISDKLDEKFLEELAVNEVILEGEGGDVEEDVSLEEKHAVPRSRNRPKREVEVASE